MSNNCPSPAWQASHSDDTFLNERSKIKRQASLYQAAAISSIIQDKIAITYKEKDAPVRLVTSVLAAGDQSVLCAGELAIPTKSILMIEFL